MTIIKCECENNSAFLLNTLSFFTPFPMLIYTIFFWYLIFLGTCFAINDSPDKSQSRKIVESDFFSLWIYHNSITNSHSAITKSDKNQSSETTEGFHFCKNFVRQMPEHCWFIVSCYNLSVKGKSLGNSNKILPFIIVNVLLFSKNFLKNQVIAIWFYCLINNLPEWIS